jgi:hypothetical protein
LYGVGKDISNSNKANDIQKNLKTPVDTIPDEFFQNREIAKQMAQVGMPQQQYNNAQNNINQTQAAALSTLGRSANPGANIGSIVRQGDNARQTLDAEDAQARQNNQRYFVQENAKLGARKDQQEQSNVFDPYTRDFNQMQAYRGAAATAQNNVINSGAALGQSLLKYAGDGGSDTPDPSGYQLSPGTSDNMAMPQQFWPSPVGSGAVVPQTQNDQDFYRRKYSGGNN